MDCIVLRIHFFYFQHKTAYELRISDCSSDVCSSDLIAQENDAVSGCEVPSAALDLDGNIIAKIARRAHRPARRFVKLAHLGVGVGENDPAGGWFGARKSVV